MPTFLKSKFIKITIINVFVLICLSMIHPVTPKLINTLNLPSYYFGLLYACLNITTFIGAPIFGVVCDTYGFKKPMIISLIGYIIGQIIFGFFGNSVTTLVARLLSGFFISGYYVCTLSYVSKITKKEDKFKNFSFFNASTSLGTAIGSLIGGFSGKTNFQNAFIIQFLLSILSILLISFLLNDLPITKKINTKLSIKFFSKKDFVNITKNNKFLYTMLILMILSFFAIQSYTSTISYYIEDILMLPTTINGVVLSLTGIFTIITNIFLNPLLDRKLNSLSIYKITALISGISIITSMLISNNLIGFVFILIFILSHTIISPVMQTIIMKNVKHNQCEIMGIQQSFKAVGVFLGSISSGFIFNIWFKLPFLLCGLSLIICFVIISFWGKKNKAII